MTGYFRRSLSALKRSLGVYWQSYGGIKALVGSPFLAAAFALAVITVLVSDRAVKVWSETAINIFPDVLGFTLGGYAIMVGFGDRRFLQALRGPDPDGTPSLYMKLNGMFVHFIVVQFVVLFFSALVDLLGAEGVAWALPGLALMYYALFTVLATALAVLDFANWFDKQPELDEKNEVLPIDPPK